MPTENVLPGSWKEAKKILSSIGMEYQIVHACVNDSMLFHGNNAHLTKCSTCEEARYDPHMLTGKVPRKSVRWFPIIPQLLHMYRCIDLAEFERHPDVWIIVDPNIGIEQRPSAPWTLTTQERKNF